MNAGAEGDDEAIGGAGREFFQDVWKSRDGRRWIRVTQSAPWPGRGGGATALVNDGWIYLLGGEAGFLEPPFADGWRTRNGQRSELVNRHARATGRVAKAPSRTAAAVEATRRHRSFCEADPPLWAR